MEGWDSNLHFSDLKSISLTTKPWPTKYDFDIKNNVLFTPFRAWVLTSILLFHRLSFDLYITFSQIEF